MWIDFHTHSFFSDGVLIPSDLAQRAAINGLPAVAITDHVDHSNLEQVINDLKKVVEPLHDDIMVIVGVELSYVPPNHIATLAKRAKQLGAQIVVVHGETIVEPGVRGTNSAALQAKDVDLLAHPGLLTKDQVNMARDNNKFLELTYRQGHCLTNGHIARLATDLGAKLLVNTDCHSIDLIDAVMALQIAKGAGLDAELAQKVVHENPKDVLNQLGLSLNY